MRFSLLFLVSLICNSVFALGNHPESSNCPTDKPYYAICTHALHNLEGWYGECNPTAPQAQAEADKHAKEYHDGNSRWTGIKKAK